MSTRAGPGTAPPATGETTDGTSSSSRRAVCVALLGNARRHHRRSMPQRTQPASPARCCGTPRGAAPDTGCGTRRNVQVECCSVVSAHIQPPPHLCEVLHLISVDGIKEVAPVGTRRDQLPVQVRCKVGAVPAPLAGLCALVLLPGAVHEWPLLLREVGRPLAAHHLSTGQNSSRVPQFNNLFSQVPASCVSGAECCPPQAAG